MIKLLFSHESSGFPIRGMHLNHTQNIFTELFLLKTNGSETLGVRLRYVSVPQASQVTLKRSP